VLVVHLDCASESLQGCRLGGIRFFLPFILAGMGGIIFSPVAKSDIQRIFLLLP
jgi:hypothetical protein